MWVVTGKGRGIKRGRQGKDRKETVYKSEWGENVVSECFRVPIKVAINRALGTCSRGIS